MKTLYYHYYFHILLKTIMENIIDDNLLNILLFLDVKSIMGCIYVNKLFSRICFTNILWKKLLAENFNIFGDSNICPTKTLTKELIEQCFNIQDNYKYYDMFKSCYKMSGSSLFRYYTQYILKNFSVYT